jgi:hypothetical protein
MGEGGDFIAHERQVAMNVRDALLQTPVKQVIFSARSRHPNEQSDHLRARQLTADTCAARISPSPNCAPGSSSAPVPPPSK